MWRVTSRILCGGVLGCALGTSVYPIFDVLAAQVSRPAAKTDAHEVAAGAPLDINTASPTELASLPGMGVVYARRVIEGRPYRAKNQLLTRGILPDAEYQRIRDLIVAHRRARP